MVESQVIGQFITTTHFCERWYERTSIPGTYFDAIIESNAYVYIGYWKGNDYYMFSSPKEIMYYVFVVIDNVLKTILTEKMYKNYPDVDLRRTKKQLRQINKSLRERWGSCKFYVNSTLVHQMNGDGEIDDPIWWYINNYDNIINLWAKHLNTPKYVEMYCKDLDVPLKQTVEFELYFGKHLALKKDVLLSPFTMKKMRDYRQEYFPIPEATNRHQKRLLKKWKIDVTESPRK